MRPIFLWVGLSCEDWFFLGKDVILSLINWDLAVSLGKGILQKINHKPVGEGLGPPEDKG